MFNFRKGYKLDSELYGIYLEETEDIKKGYITREDLYVSNNDNIRVYQNSDSIEFKEVFVYTKDMLISQDNFMEWENHYKNGNLVVLNEDTFKLLKEEIENSTPEDVTNIKENIDQILNGQDARFEDILDSLEEVEYLEFKDANTGKVEQIILGDTVYVQKVEPEDNYKFSQYIEQLYARDNMLGQMELSIAQDVLTKEYYIMGKGVGMESSICFDENFIKDRLKEVIFTQDDPIDSGKLLEVLVRDDVKYEKDNNIIVIGEEFEIEM